MLCWKFAEIGQLLVSELINATDAVNGARKKPDVGWFLLDCGYWKAHNDREYDHYTYTNGFYKVAVNVTSQKKRPSLPRQRPLQSS